MSSSLLLRFTPQAASGGPRARGFVRFLGVILSVAAAACGADAGDSTLTTDGDPATYGGSGGSSAPGAGGSAGQATAGSAGAAGGGAGGAAGASVSFSPYGYFDVEFKTVEASIAMGPGKTVPPSRASAEGRNKLRIDIPQPTPKDWKAVVTPRWGVPSLFDVKQSGDALVLTGSTSISSKDFAKEEQPPEDVGLSVSDVWQTITIQLSGKNASGVFTAQGQEDVLLGDEAWSGKLVGGGKVSVDTTPPEARTPTSSKGFGPADQRLPWDGIPVSFAEPLSSAEALAKVALVAGDEAGTSVPVTWLTPSANAKAAGVSSLLGVLQSWDDPPVAPTLRVAKDFLDPAMNRGEEFATMIGLLAVPQAIAPTQGFEGDVVDYAAWGGALQLGGLAPSPECEGYGCMLLGPFQTGACGVESLGVAARLLVEKDKPTELKVRLRVLVAEGTPGAGVPPFLTSLPVLSLQVARPGKPPETHDILAPSPEDLGEAAGEFRYATPWTTIVQPLPTGIGEVGFALRAGGVHADVACEATASKPSLKVKVLVESVSLN
jgi:hypothetical protein